MTWTRCKFSRERKLKLQLDPVPNPISRPEHRHVCPPRAAEDVGTTGTLHLKFTFTATGHLLPTMRGRGVLLADPISDLFARIRNGQTAKRATIHHPYSRFARDVVNVLIRQGYVSSLRIIPPKSPREPQFNQMQIALKYDNYGHPAIKRIRRVSKPSRRVYRSIAQLPLASNGLGSWILSTPRGVLHCAEAREMNVGGEILGEVF